ncbi:hypothetical protein NDU88_003129 [Pleurodeles waltl]|uniref:Uncharacterized protein n=1 Tax=Pleurodeles waltl TaxID=8319 RepID=A0AAV7RHP4_PLEWA|nr:hypothetical protein NDU88_003129 [Pleurodeles waltl]
MCLGGLLGQYVCAALEGAWPDCLRWRPPKTGAPSWPTEKSCWYRRLGDPVRYAKWGEAQLQERTVVVESLELQTPGGGRRGPDGRAGKSAAWATELRSGCGHSGVRGAGAYDGAGGRAVVQRRTLCCCGHERRAAGGPLNS